ncbi:hypothetical protein STEG23_013172, partial [Scotinomys teguina]
MDSWEVVNRESANLGRRIPGASAREGCSGTAGVLSALVAALGTEFKILDTGRIQVTWYIKYWHRRPLISFSCLIALSKTSSLVLNSHEESEHPLLVPDFKVLSIKLKSPTIGILLKYSRPAMDIRHVTPKGVPIRKMRTTNKPSLRTYHFDANGYTTTLTCNLPSMLCPGTDSRGLQHSRKPEPDIEVKPERSEQQSKPATSSYLYKISSLKR